MKRVVAALLVILLIVGDFFALTSLTEQSIKAKEGSVSEQVYGPPEIVEKELPPAPVLSQPKLLQTMEPVTVTDAVYVLEDFEHGYDRWKVHGDRYTNIEIGLADGFQGEPVRFGNHALKLSYDFRGAAAGVSGVYAQIKNSEHKINIPGEPHSIGMWFYSDGGNLWLRGQIRDSKGTQYNLDFTNDNPEGTAWEGWKYVEAKIHQDAVAPFVLDNQVVRYMSTKAENKQSGVIYIDNIRAVYGSTDEDVTNPTLQKFTPAPESTVESNQPEISVIAQDTETGIDPEQIYMRIDGVSVQPIYDPETGKVSYTPEKTLVDGYHEAWVEVKDRAGNHTFKSWSFMVSTGGAEFTLSGPEKVYAGDEFVLQLRMDDIQALQQAEATLHYNPKLMQVVDADNMATGVQVSLGEKLSAQHVQRNEVDNSTGEIRLAFEQLHTISSMQETETLAEIKFQVALDASGEVIVRFTEGTITFAQETNAIPVIVPPFIAKIEQPLVLSVEGISLGSLSTVRVTDQDGRPVEGAEVKLLDNLTLLKTTRSTKIIKGGSGVPDPIDLYKEVEAGSYFIKHGWTNGEYFRIFNEQGSTRYYYIPVNDVEEILPWGKPLGTTDEHGQFTTSLLTVATASPELAPFKLQATKGNLVSQVLELAIVPQLGSKKPENIVLTWQNDPKRTQSFTWRTAPYQDKSIVELVQAGDLQGFASEQVLRIRGENWVLVDEIGEMRIHEAEARNLTPGTSYNYRLGDGTEANWSDVYTFTTEALENEPYTFLFATDTQALDETGFSIWTKLMGQAREKYPQARFILHGGDIVENGNKLIEWEYFLNASQPFSPEIPIMATLGNHEVYGHGAETYRSVFQFPLDGPEGEEEFVYSFDYGDAHFMILNSEADNLDKQVNWLREEVNKSSKKWNIVMFHRAPYHSNPLRGTDRTRYVFSPVIEELGIDLALVGHDHAYMRTYPMKNGQPQTGEGAKGTTYVIGGSAGPKFYPGSAQEYTKVLFAQTPGVERGIQVYTAVTVEKNQLKLTVTSIDGQLVDEFVIEKADPPRKDGSSGGGSSSAGSTVANPNPAHKLTADNKETSFKIGDVYFEIPAGATVEDINITVEKLRSTTGLTFQNGYHLVSDVFEITKDKTGNFNKAITITLPFNASAVDEKTQEIAIFWLDETTKEWIKLNNIQVDYKAGKVSGAVDHFTKFAVLAIKKEDTDAVEEEMQEIKPEFHFTDIAGHWAEQDILRLATKGIISGYHDQSFKPNQQITRAEFASILAKVFHLEQQTGKVFADTAKHWSKEIVSAAYAAGITQGYNEQTFAPDAPITREQMAIMIANATGLSIREAHSLFVDQEKISPWAINQVLSVVENKLMNGYPDQTFRPQNFATRAEAVTIILRAINN